MIDEGLPAAVSISSLSTRKVRCCDSLVFRHMLYAFKKGSSSVRVVRDRVAPAVPQHQLGDEPAGPQRLD